MHPKLTDLIFWWTGSTAWALLSLAFFVWIIAAICVAGIQACRRARGWLMAKLIMSHKERMQIASVIKRVGYPGNCTSDQLEKWLTEVRKEYRKCTQN